MTAAQCRRWSLDTLALLPRMEHAATRLHQLGPRPVLELLLEIAAEHDCMTDVAERLDSYSRMTPRVVQAIGANTLPPRRPVLVPSDERLSETG